MSQTTIVPTPFVGNTVGLFFVVRPVASLTPNSAYQFTAISNFATLDSTSSNCVGRQPIQSALALNYLNQSYSRSWYTSENAMGCNLAGAVTKNAANVYAWSFSSSLPVALQHVLLLS